MSKHPASSPQVDMRGFQYDLMPFVKKQEWQMESLQRQLSKAQAAVVQAQEELAAMQGALQVQSQEIQKASLARPDPLAHQRGLEFLVHLLHRIQEQQLTVEELQAEKAAIQSECVAQQCKLDGLAEHQAQARQDFAVEQARLAASEADRDWIGRLKQRARNSALSGDAL